MARRIRSQDILDQLYDLFISRGKPEHNRSDNAPEFTARAVRNWLANTGVKTLFIEPGTPWENGNVESLIGKLRDELLNGEVFDTLLEVSIVIGCWRRKYNRYRPQAPEVFEVKNLTLQMVHCRGQVTKEKSLFFYSIPISNKKLYTAKWIFTII